MQHLAVDLSHPVNFGSISEPYFLINKFPDIYEDLQVILNLKFTGLILLISPFMDCCDFSL